MRIVSGMAFWLAKASTLLWRPMVGRRRLPAWAMLHTRARHSGRPYSTPVQIRAHGEHFVIALPWPDRSEWIRNVEAAGGCTLTWRGEQHRTDAPERIGYTEAAPAYSAFERFLIRLIGWPDQFLRLHRVPRSGAG